MIEEINDSNKFNLLAQHITQSWQWGEFRRLTPTIKKVIRLGSYTNGKLIKVFQIFFHRVPYLPYTIAYLPRSIAPAVVEIEEIKKYCRRDRAIFLKIESLSPHPLLPNAYRLPASPVLPQHTIYIDLTQNEEKLLAQTHGKTRYNIKLAQKKGVVVKEETTEEGLEKFIKILEQTEKRQGFHSHNPDYYRLLYETLQPHKIVHILNAYLPPSVYCLTPIASVMLFRFKDFLYYPYGGSSHEYRQFMAPQLLHWEAIKLGKKLGCHTYDLWGSYKDTPNESDPWWGFYRLKKGLGGTDVDFPQTVDIPLSPLYPLFVLTNNLRWTILRAILRIELWWEKTRNRKVTLSTLSLF